MSFLARRILSMPRDLRKLGFALPLLALSVIPSSGSGPSRRADSLPAPVQALSRCFRLQRAGELQELLQESGKIRASAPSLGLKPGYYSADQIHFVLQDVFRVHKTLHFRILRGAEIPPHSVRQTVLARWIYRRGDSRELTADLSFDLVRRTGSWRLQEIREIL